MPEDYTKDIKQRMIKIAKIMYDKDLTDSIGGNIAVREGDRIFVTKTGASVIKQWDIDEDWIIETDLKGRTLKKEDQEFLSHGSSTLMRLVISIPTIKCAIHGHAKHILPFSSLRIAMPIVNRFPRNQGFPPYIECIPNKPTDCKPESYAILKYFKYLYDRNPNTAFACMSPGHGLFVGGRNLEDAFKKFHILDGNARTFLMMEKIKSFPYYQEARAREKDNLYVYWADIERTKVEEYDFVFEESGMFD